MLTRGFSLYDYQSKENLRTRGEGINNRVVHLRWATIERSYAMEKKELGREDEVVKGLVMEMVGRKGVLGTPDRRQTC
ncbi:hypothetical protein E3N88_14114 [Mikania micrantha]|uniref:Uncharacterized protein n=1 Tax=Mikania micrantha TaxID=192012 RepID=A0A5N6P0K2_9ASTR|nr:hypothetical protein E3N88_14114 [Mikania micrantha]